MTKDALRTALGRGQPLSMAWVTLGVPYVVEAMGEAGHDLVLIDQQHGLIGHAEMVNCLIAAKAAGLPALVRPLTSDAGLIGAALDAGAQGVLCPLVETVADVEAYVRAAKYPPDGLRSWGPYRGKLVAEGDYTERSKDWTFLSVQLETRAAIDNLDDILSVKGLDMVLVGPNDLALALTSKRDIRAPEVMEACGLILRKAREANVFTAIFANDLDYAKPFAKAGWDVITVGTDMSVLGSASAVNVESLRD